ncbi:uncharacterized protein [Panulirus ornatus]|uniref:uncharacterized protein isoform X2 n=1 Tax=Panulirus ornatus TaxID=150431 RepID=UPI003A8835D1
MNLVQVLPFVSVVTLHPSVGWRWWSVGLLVTLVANVQAVPKRFNEDQSNTSHQHSSNDVYPVVPRTIREQAFDLALARNMSQTTDLREFIMKYVQDERICFSKTLQEIIIGKEETDKQAEIWWSRRCGGRSSKPVATPSVSSESTLIRYRRKSSNRTNHKNTSDLSDKDWRKFRKLRKNKNISCSPKKAVVELPNDEPHRVTLLPSCVYIRRCSGCCQATSLQCRPTKVKNKKFKVMALTSNEFRGKRFADSQALRTVIVQEHKNCSCECKVQPQDCSSSQVYSEHACTCYCPANISKSCPPGKVWNERDCACVCNGVSECTTGRVFNTTSCRCLRT